MESQQKSKTYQIRIKEELESQWSEWFDNLTISSCKDGTTLMTGPLVDDAALHGILKKVRDLGLSLLSVNLIDPALKEEVDNEQ